MRASRLLFLISVTSQAMPLSGAGNYVKCIFCRPLRTGFLQERFTVLSTCLQYFLLGRLVWGSYISFRGALIGFRLDQITSGSIRLRVPLIVYERIPSCFPQGCVFFGQATNQNYLKYGTALVYDQYWLGRGLRTAITVQIGFQCVCKNMKLITRMAWKPKLGYCYTMGYLTWVHFSIADR